MRAKPLIIILILILVLLSASVLGLIWLQNNYVIVDKAFYAKDLQVLDLRGEDISISHYQKLHQALPDCQIQWNIPFQDTSYPHDSTELQVTSLTLKDINTLSYFSQLQVLDAQQCTDFSQLITAAETYPDLEIRYLVPVAGTAYPQNTTDLYLQTLSLEDLEMIPYLQKLESITLSGFEQLQYASALQNFCHNEKISFSIRIGDESYPEDAKKITVSSVPAEHLKMVELMPELKEIHLIDPVAEYDDLVEFGQTHKNLKLSWDTTICGKVYPHTTKEVDLSDVTITSLEEVEQAMTYLPDATNLFLGFCGIDNEEIAAYRERSREHYKVVWVVDLSGKMKVRTDIDNFMPSRDGWGYVRDGEIDNIRYCEDLICMDIGHMGIKDVSFLEPLVNLEYLILAHTEVQYIDAVANLKKLKFLELDWSCVRDISPLVHCTALEDLNIGMTWPNINPVLEMTWLKNLYVIKGNTKANFAEALPNTRVVATGDYTVSNGWRNLPNYYAMRDILGMHYM